MQERKDHVWSSCIDLVQGRTGNGRLTPEGWCFGTGGLATGHMAMNGTRLCEAGVPLLFGDGILSKPSGWANEQKGDLGATV